MTSEEKDYIVLSSDESDEVPVDINGSSSESDSTDESEGEDFERNYFIKRFTARDLRILYLPQWFVAAARIYEPLGQKMMNYCVRFGYGGDREALVKVIHREVGNSIVHELSGDWQEFTKVNRMKAKRRYSMEFIKGGAWEWDYIRVTEV